MPIEQSKAVTKIKLNNLVRTKTKENKRKKNKPKSEAEVIRLREMAAERKRRQRERIRTNKDKHEQEKEKERERYKRRKAQGKLKPISERDWRAQKKQRAQWRKNNKTYYEKKREQGILPTDVQLNGEVNTQSNKIKLGRKKILASRSLTARKLAKVKMENEKNRKKSERYKQKYYRLKNKINISKHKSPESPGTKVENILNVGDRNQIKRKLLLGEVLSAQIQNNKEKCVNLQEKQALSEIVSGPLFKKYKLMSAAPVSPHNQRKVMKSSKGKVLKDKTMRRSVAAKLQEAVTLFLEDDENSMITPGMNSTVTRSGKKKTEKISKFKPMETTQKVCISDQRKNFFHNILPCETILDSQPTTFKPRHVLVCQTRKF